METLHMDIVFSALFTLSAIVAFLFFAAYWKPILIFFVIMLIVLEPKVGIPIAFIFSFLVMVWFERKNLSIVLVIESFKFSFYVTIGAIIIGLVVEAIFAAGSGYSGCSRGSPTGC